MESWKKQAARLLVGMAIEEKSDPSVCPYVPSKTQVSRPENTEHRTLPARLCGVSPDRLCRMLKAFEEEERAQVRTVYVVKDGCVLIDASRPGYDSHTAYLSHSMAKSVTGMLIGTLIDEGALALTDTVVSFFPEYPYKDRRFAAMTVEHLLTMSSGVVFAEAGVVTETDWGRAFFASSLQFAPGKEFMYNSMNSYILGRIAEKVSGLDLLTLANDRLFLPLGIRDVFWEKDALGFAKGGFGLYLSAASWAKLGSLYISGGEYDGVRVLSSEWIQMSSAAHKDTPPTLGDYAYGYHVWVNPMAGEVLFNGMLGQNVWICPALSTVAVLTGGNSEFFQQSPALSILRSFLSEIPADDRPLRGGGARLKQAQAHFFENRLPVQPLAPKRGLLPLFKKSARYPFDTAWNGVLGTYCLEKNAAALLPLFVRLMQNTYAPNGIGTIAFTREGEDLWMTLTEGAETLRLPLGLYGYRSAELHIRGEVYLVRSAASATTDEHANTVYVIDIVFPELPNTRCITVTPTGDGCITVTLTECPDRHILDSLGAAFLTPGSKAAFAMGIVQRLIGENFLEERSKALFEKTLHGGRTDAPETDGYIAAAEADRAASLRRYAVLQTVIRRLLGTGDSLPADTPSYEAPSTPSDKDTGE